MTQAAYAKRLRNTAFGVSAASVVFLAFAFYWLTRLGDDGDEPRLAEFVRFRPIGERLPFQQLAENERIVVTHVVNGDRQDRCWTYVVDGALPESLTRLTRDFTYEPNYGLRPTDITATDLFALQPGDRAGLDTMVEVLRTVPAQPVPGYYDTYVFEYFRESRLIGEERFVDDFFRHDTPGFERLPPEITREFSLERWEAIQTFSAITRRGPANDSEFP